MTILVVEVGQNRFQIPLNEQRVIPIYGSLQDAQQRADAFSGCESDCACPAWAECDDDQYRQFRLPG